MMAAGSMAMARRPRGKPQNFTPEQNDALRKALLDWKDQNELTQQQVGEKLHVEQQGVARLLSAKGDGGFSYQTATRAARILGYIGVDAFFEAVGVALDRRAADPDPTTHPTQADGMRAARIVGVSEKAIIMVNRDVPAGEYHKASWWCTRYQIQQEALDEARRELEPKAKQSAPKSTRKLPAANE